MRRVEDAAPYQNLKVMGYIKINQEKATDREALVKLCPFGAIEEKGGKLEINAGCRMCRMCIKKGGGVFELVEEDAAPSVDKSKWRGVAVVAEIDADGKLHPVALELLGKARELADKIKHPVLALVIGSGTDAAVEKLLAGTLVAAQTATCGGGHGGCGGHCGHGCGGCSHH